MILGRVSAAREAVLPLQLRGRDGRETRVDAVLVTGFTHDLTLPAAMVQALDLVFVTLTHATLAGEVVVSANYYRAEIMWDGHLRAIAVLQMEGTSLIGMGLLHRQRVTLEVVADGKVMVEPL